MNLTCNLAEPGLLLSPSQRTFPVVTGWKRGLTIYRESISTMRSQVVVRLKFDSALRGVVCVSSLSDGVPW